MAQSTPLKPDRPSISGMCRPPAYLYIIRYDFSLCMYIVTFSGVSAQYVSDVSESVSGQSSGTNMFVQVNTCMCVFYTLHNVME